jgi:hypothetical protein
MTRRSLLDLLQIALALGATALIAWLSFFGGAS